LGFPLQTLTNTEQYCNIEIKQCVVFVIKTNYVTAFHDASTFAANDHILIYILIVYLSIIKRFTVYIPFCDDGSVVLEGRILGVASVVFRQPHEYPSIAQIPKHTAAITTIAINKPTTVPVIV
jgi:hypothetical protein